MKIGIVQINPIVGDIDGNCEKIRNAVAEAARQGADFCITPELALVGYPPRDFLLYAGFVEKAEKAAQTLATQLVSLPPLLLGSIEANHTGMGNPVHNCALWLHKGKIKNRFHKTLLPNYDVFDEARYFEPSRQEKQDAGILHFNGQKIAVTICEDAWNDKDFWEARPYAKDPLEQAMACGADFVVNLSASPFSLGKQQLRETMLGSIAAKYATTFVYVNQVGGNDDLLFDGRSCIFNPKGDLLFRGPAFTETVAVVESNSTETHISSDDFTPEAEAWRALVLGVKDYASKSGFSKALLGLSGGIDSALTATIAVAALGAENVVGVLMPSPYSSQGSVDDSLELAKNLGIQTITLPIESMMQSFAQSLAAPFHGYEPDTTEENIQSRIRGNLLMALSNKYRSLLLTTGNKSELAVGYCTIYGDMAGGLAVISDASKSLVFSLCHWINKTMGHTIPENILTKAPSAELRPDQKDEDSLPPYEVLDAIIELHIEKSYGAEQIIAQGFESETVHHVLRLIRMAEFKRRQAAPGIRLTTRSFGTGWRMPLACKRNF